MSDVDNQSDQEFDQVDETKSAMQQVVLVKHGHRYIFRYAQREEWKLLSRLIEMVRDPKSDLNWFDAAVLSHQMGQRISQEFEKMLRA